MMKSIIYSLTLIVSSVLLYSCSPKDKGAHEQLDAARTSLTKGDFVQAKQHIDSIQMLYPKSFDEIKGGMALLDTVRRAENDANIAFCDSLIKAFEPKVDSIKKKDFVYKIDKKYQETGVYIPRIIPSDGNMTSTTLRPGVGADGQLYIESVYVGGNQMHSKVKVATTDGSYAETLPVTSDGLYFRFSNMGKYFETIKFAGANDNGVSQFIFVNENKPITVTLNDPNKNTFVLPQISKKAITQSVRLSKVMTRLDSLKTAKEQSEFKNYYLTHKGEKAPEPNTE